MTYVKWNGIHRHPAIFITGIFGLTGIYFLTRWMYDKSDIVNNFVNNFGSFNIFMLTISGISILAALTWWFVARLILPLLMPPIGKIFFRGMKLYIDKNQIRQKPTYGVFLSRYMYLVLASFSLNFLLTTTYFSTPKNSVSPLSFVISLVILTLFVPTQWILQDIGIRALDEDSLQITKVDDFFSSFVKDYLITTSVMFSFINILVQSNLTNLPLYLQVSIVRSLFPCFIIAYFFTILLGSIPDSAAWKQKGVLLGETTTSFDE